MVEARNAMERLEPTTKPENYRRRSILLTLLAVLPGVFFLSGGAQTELASQNGYCNPHIIPPKNDPDGYRMRGDRCEGTYTQQVVGDGILTIASFTESLDEVDPNSVDSLSLRWNQHEHGVTQIRAMSIKPGMLYQMDTRLPEGVNSYEWKTDVMKHYLSAGQYGVLGSVFYQLTTRRVEAYIPLKVGSARQNASSQDYRVYLYTIAQPAKLSLTVATVNTDGTRGGYLIGDSTSGRDLKDGPYPREGKIPLRLNLKAGLYYVTIGAELKDGSPRSLAFWLYVP
jgi:hypothetical protein